MRSRKIYVLMMALGLVMVWLGFLFIYELKIVEKHRPLAAQEQTTAAYQNPLASRDEPQEVPQSSTKGGTAASTGFPIALAGLGLVFVVGCVFRFRHHYK